MSIDKQDIFKAETGKLLVKPIKPYNAQHYCYDFVAKQQINLIFFANITWHNRQIPMNQVLSILYGKSRSLTITM